MLYHNPEGSTYQYWDYQSHGQVGPEIYFHMSRIFELQFSNSHNMLAYLFMNEQVWIEDLTAHQSILVYQYPTPIKSPSPFDDVYPDLIWLPDDYHLIIDNKLPGMDDLLLNLETGQIETWSSTCDSVALSPRTARLAVWCTQPNGGPITVLEWGGEVWQTFEPPQEKLFQAYTVGDEDNPSAFPLYYNSAWSVDGQQVAFFDPADPTGALWIADSSGTLFKKLEASAYWLSSDDTLVNSYPLLPIQWAKDGSHILFFGVGAPERACPDRKSWITDEMIKNTACWQVLEVSTSQIIWQAGDLLSQLDPHELNYEPGMLWLGAALSSNGSRVAVSIYNPPSVTIYVSDTKNKKLLAYSMGRQMFDVARWAVLPNLRP